MRRVALAAALVALPLLASVLARAEAPLAALAPRAEADAAPLVLMRSYQTADLLRAQRLAIGALQDLGFALESADAASGAITASRLDAHPLRVAITVALYGDESVSASVATDYAGTPSRDPRAAEAFFAAYEAALHPPPDID